MLTAEHQDTARFQIDYPATEVEESNESHKREEVEER